MSWSKVARSKAKVSRGRKLGIAALVAGGLVGATWIGIHEVPWLGPALADGARSLVGPGPVAWLEDVAYGAADWVNVKARAEEAPKTFWEVPAEVASGAAPAAPAAPGALPDEPPSAFEAPFASVATPVDGRWLPMRPAGDDGPTALYKSLVHPDPKRPFAAVAVVAMDLHRAELHLVEGTDEPKSQKVPRAERTGLVADAHLSSLLAAFNGGFKAMHGNYGMRIGHHTYVPPRDIACTIGKAPDGAMSIATFSTMQAEEPTLSWYRQTPPCLMEAGAQNPGLLHEFNRNWGATVGGDTIIRRSALGLSKDGRYAFYALGDAVTAQSIGRAMESVGAHDAAQLDVNFSYPRFLSFEKAEGEAPKATDPLVPDLKYQQTDYVRGPSQRDFFYVTRKKANPS